MRTEREQTPARTSRLLYLDDDVYEWLKQTQGASRGISRFVREVLRECMDKDKEKQ